MLDKIVVEAKNYVTNLLKDFKNEGYFFHNLEHTLEVFERATYIGEKEGINDDLMEMLQLGALFHDTGFIQTFDNNEINGFYIFEERINKNYPDYPLDRMDMIKGIIMATTVSIQPQNILEEIIKDADMDNVGRVDFFEKGELLKLEYKRIGGIDYDEDGRKNRNFKLLKDFKFYTETAMNQRNDGFQRNFDILKKKLGNV